MHEPNMHLKHPSLFLPVMDFFIIRNVNLIPFPNCIIKLPNKLLISSLYMYIVQIHFAKHFNYNLFFNRDNSITCTEFHSPLFITK